MRQTDRRQTASSLNAPPIRGGHNKPDNIWNRSVAFNLSITHQPSTEAPTLGSDGMVEVDLVKSYI